MATLLRFRVEWWYCEPWGLVVIPLVDCFCLLWQQFWNGSYFCLIEFKKVSLSRCCLTYCHFSIKTTVEIRGWSLCFSLTEPTKWIWSRIQAIFIIIGTTPIFCQYTCRSCQTTTRYPKNCIIINTTWIFRPFPRTMTSGLWQRNPVLPNGCNTAGSSGEWLSFFTVWESGVMEVIDHERSRALTNLVVVIGAAIVQTWRWSVKYSTVFLNYFFNIQIKISPLSHVPLEGQIKMIGRPFKMW